MFKNHNNLKVRRDYQPLFGKMKPRSKKSVRSEFLVTSRAESALLLQWNPVNTDTKGT